jgi:hypothetical protein
MNGILMSRHPTPAGNEFTAARIRFTTGHRTHQNRDCYERYQNLHAGKLITIVSRASL